MQTLRETLTLEQISETRFQGWSPDDPAARIYGGQVIGQALLAAYETVAGQVCHSLHAYFLRAGDTKEAVVLDVETVRDGPTFSTRRAIASQGERRIMVMATSFMVAEDGFEHQAPAPQVPPAEGLRDDNEAIAEIDPTIVQLRQQQRQVLDVRSVPPRKPMISAEPGEPAQRYWVRAREPLGTDIRLQQAALAYASDLAMLSTTMRPHGLTWTTPGLQYASLDHSIWFHRATDFGRWHLYDLDSPVAAGGRGLNRGAYYTADGVLVASVAQESIMRTPKAR